MRYLLLLLPLLFVGAAQPQPADRVNWHTMEAVVDLLEAGALDKPVFVDVYTDWCGWCKRMDATTFSDPEVAQLLNELFIPVKFDGEARRDVTVKGTTFSYVAEGRRGYHQLAAALMNNQLSYPTVVLLDENFQLLQPLPGYRQANELAPILQFIGEGHYKTTSWEDFQAGSAN